MGILTVALFSLLLFSQQHTLLFVLVLIWGIGIAGIGLSLQVRVLQLAPDATDVAMAIFSGIYNIGIGGGALIGQQIMTNLGLNYIGIIGGILAMIGTIFFLIIHLKYRYLPIKAIH